MCRPQTFLVFLSLGILVSGSLTGCGRKDHDAADGTAKKDRTVVRVSSPAVRMVTDYEYFTGRTDAVDRVEVRARVTGYLKEINFEAGKEVKIGQVLFLIDPRPYQAQRDQAQSQILLTDANLKLANANLARGKEIAKTAGAVSKQELDQLLAQAASAEATLKSAKANLETADLNLNFTEVTSPVTGIVGRNLLTVGNLVTQDSTLLTVIVSMDPMYAYFDVDERTLLRVQKLIREGKVQVKEGSKTPVQFGLANEGDDYPHEGYVDFVNNEVDTSTGTIQVRCVLPNVEVGGNPDIKGAPRFLLTPGLFVRVRLPIGQAHQALLIHQSALGTDQGKKFVYVVNAQNVVEYRPVIPAALEGDGMQVVQPVKIIHTKEGVRQVQEGEQGEDSLRPTDRIIVGGLQRVRSGMTVEPKASAKGGK